MKFALWAAVGALSLGVAHAYDGQVSINKHLGSIATDNGGPYEVSVIGTPAGPLGQVKAAAGGGMFLSFCIELNENLKFGGPYDANVSNAAVLGGIAGGSPDPISKATAWLYSQFRAGLIATTPQGQDDLQNAIWWLEEEITTPTTAGALLVSQAVTATGAADAATARTINANGEYGVRVLNLYDGPANSGAPDYLNQDLLALVPEPSTYAFAALLGLPVLLQWRRRFRS